jgi:hypothetical protein
MLLVYESYASLHLLPVFQLLRQEPDHFILIYHHAFW